MNFKKPLIFTALSFLLISTAHAESEAAAYDHSLSQYESDGTQNPNALESSRQQSLDVAEESLVFPTANQAANYDDMEAIDARINTGVPTDWSQPQY